MATSLDNWRGHKAYVNTSDGKVVCGGGDVGSDSDTGLSFLSRAPESRDRRTGPDRGNTSHNVTFVPFLFIPCRVPFCTKCLILSPASETSGFTL
jgi:hypothetical protein